MKSRSLDELIDNTPLSAERVVYWYFRLNGFFLFENFIIHPPYKGGQRTDADLIGVRFPYRKEFLIDHPNDPMQDDAKGLGLTTNRIDVVIVEITRNQPCKLNGPWTADDKQNVNRVLAAIGCLNGDKKIQAAADAIYKIGVYREDRLQIRLIAVGLNTNPNLLKQVTQLIWRQVLKFMWQRFNKYKNQKKDKSQWHFDGQRLYKMAIALEPELFVRQVLREIGANDRE
jgi:hypothetical protein